MVKSRIPTETECMQIMSEVGLASPIMHHSMVVKRFALELADDLEQNGVPINKELLLAAALLHDIMKMEAQVCHGIEGGEFLRKKGFHEVAAVVEKHCLNNLIDPKYIPKTTEEKLLMYADLRVGTGCVISLDERFEYIRQRYNPRDHSRFNEFRIFAEQLEWELCGKLSEKK